MTWFYFLLILTGLVLIILLIPIRISINTDEGKYTAGWPGLLRIGIRQDEENEIVVNIWIIFVRYSIYPFKKGMKKEETKKLKQKKEKKNQPSLPKWKHIKFVTRIFWQIIKRSKLKEFYLNIDTKNVIINSLLFPAFAIINTRRNIDLNVNYSGNFSLILEGRNNLLNFIIVIIKNLLKRNQ